MVEIVANCKKFIFINTQLSNIVMLDTCISLCVYECSCCICVNVCICELVLILVLGIFIFFLISVNYFVQCFDTSGWASGGASSL